MQFRNRFQEVIFYYIKITNFCRKIVYKIDLLHLHFVAYISAGFNCSECFLGLFSLKKSFLKYQKSYYPNGDRRISNIEDLAKEFELLATPKRNPHCKCGFKNWEVKHIYNAAMQKGGIAISGKRGNT